MRCDYIILVRNVQRQLPNLAMLATRMKQHAMVQAARVGSCSFPGCCLWSCAEVLIGPWEVSAGNHRELVLSLQRRAAFEAHRPSPGAAATSHGAATQAARSPRPPHPPRAPPDRAPPDFGLPADCSMGRSLWRLFSTPASDKSGEASDPLVQGQPKY